MNRFHWHTVVQCAAFAGFVVSFFLFGEYGLPPSAGGCPIGGGCHVVRACRLLVPSVTWPVLGTGGFLVILALSLSNRTWAQRALRYVATLGALVGVGLMLAQPFMCGAFCPYCLITDTASVVVAIGAWRARGGPVPATRQWAFAASVLVVGAGLLWRYNVIDDAPHEPTYLAQIPAVVVREQQPGSVTIVEFMDFTCSHCRKEHPELMQAISSYGAKVHVRRRIAPPGSPEAEIMACTQYCAEAQGKTFEMVDLLVGTPIGTRENCESQAARLGLDVATFRKCLDAPETTARLAEDRAAATEAQVLLLPTLFIGHDRFDGDVPTATLRKSIDRALGGSGAEATAPTK